jgi:hypothetical protein
MTTLRTILPACNGGAEQREKPHAAPPEIRRMIKDYRLFHFGAPAAALPSAVAAQAARMAAASFYQFTVTALDEPDFTLCHFSWW